MTAVVELSRVTDVELKNPLYPGYKLSAFQHSSNGRVFEHIIIHSRPILELGRVPLLRISSACFTGDIFGDARCDCNDQLKTSMQLIGEAPGLIIYHLDQEGCGHGISFKLMTYKNSDELGFSTYRAMKQAGRDDARDYQATVAILNALGVERVALITNSPAKVADLVSRGVIVDRIVPLVSEGRRSYLEVKREEQGHWLTAYRLT